MVHIQILDTYHSPILSRPLFQWPRRTHILFSFIGLLTVIVQLFGSKLADEVEMLFNF